MEEAFSFLGKQPAIPPRGLIADRPVLAASERNLVQIPRRRRRPRGGEEESSRLGTDSDDLVHVPFAPRQLAVTTASEVVQVGLAPTIPVGDPDESVRTRYELDVPVRL